jgi:hypothetical protein
MFIFKIFSDFLLNFSKYSSDFIKECFNHSKYQDKISFCGRVSKNSEFIKTNFGCLNAQIIFFIHSKSTQVFHQTDESNIESKLVGT